MAKDMQSKKRKASVPEVEAEKVKKVKNAVATPSEAPAKKRKATEDAAPAKVKKTKTPKDTSEVKAPTTTDKTPKKTSSTSNPKETSKDPKDTVAAAKKPITAKPKKATAVTTKKVTASKEKVDKPEIEADEEMDSGLEDEDKDMDEESDSEPDDQTKAMLKGFESDGDDEEVDDGLPEGTEVPVRRQLSKKEEKKLAKIKESEASDKPGVVYIGRIPHGFYENEMRAYFGQFGKILQLRMSRNKKTGAGKHYGWIKFESAVVADIVARTMDNYLMFGHILKVKLIPEEQVNEDWFKGANKRFKKVPWNKMEGRNLEQGKSEETWNTKVEKEAEKREKKSRKLKEIGYEFKAPTLKTATGVAKPKAPEELTNGESEVKAVEAAPVIEADKPSKKGKKTKKIQVSNGDPIPPTANKEENRSVTFPPTKEDVAESIDALIAEVTEKPKKGKKTKVVKATEADVEEPTIVAVEESTEPKPKKEKKVKKTKTVEIAETTEVAVPEPVADIPEKKLKTKKSKASLVETTATPVVAPEETVRKSKKVKKSKATA
ncbi:hypothetical protein DL98DRAFT_512286 [Cadophora sp. DSE1049]|nr:hypothetical protein DL98DRAFT_512286 [Cadophora sp. DSE1049]